LGSALALLAREQFARRVAPELSWLQAAQLAAALV